MPPPCAHFSTKFLLTYTVALFLPTTFLNSAFWGQCDSIYSCFLLLVLYAFYQKQFVRGFVFYGLAFAFKFQSIFLLPWIICYYFYCKQFSLLHLLISVVVFWLSGIIAFCNGRNPLDVFLIYASQTENYPNMWMNISSFWMLVGNNYERLSFVAIVLSLAILGYGLFLVVSGSLNLDSAEKMLQLAAWMQWVCMLFMPAMHERYTYFLDILLLVLCCMNKKYLPHFCISAGISTITYGTYLFGNASLTQWHVIFYLAAWIHFSYNLFRTAEQVSPVIENSLLVNG